MWRLWGAAVLRRSTAPRSPAAALCLTPCRPGAATAPTGGSWGGWARRWCSAGARRSPPRRLQVRGGGRAGARLCPCLLQPAQTTTLAPGSCSPTAWREAAQRRAYQRRVLTAAAARLAHLGAARALTAWRAWLGERHGKAERLAVAVCRWRSAQLRGCWDAWRARVEGWRSQRALLQRAVQAMLSARLRAAWAAWQAYAEARREAAARLGAAMGAWQRSSLRKAFQARCRVGQLRALPVCWRSPRQLLCCRR